MIVITRHGQADSPAYSDRNRRLTEKGRADAAARGRQLASSGRGHFDIAMVSPYIRALETLDELKGSLEIGHVQITDELVPNASSEVSDFLRYLDESGKHVLAVTHMPLAGLLVNDLCGPAAMGTFDPGDYYVLEKKPGSELYSVTCTTNSFSLM